MWAVDVLTGQAAVDYVGAWMRSAAGGYGLDAAKLCRDAQARSRAARVRLRLAARYSCPVGRRPAVTRRRCLDFRGTAATSLRSERPVSGQDPPRLGRPR